MRIRLALVLNWEVCALFCLSWPSILKPAMMEDLGLRDKLQMLSSHGRSIKDPRAVKRREATKVSAANAGI